MTFQRTTGQELTGKNHIDAVLQVQRQVCRSKLNMSIPDFSQSALHSSVE